MELKSAVKLNSVIKYYGSRDGERTTESVISAARRDNSYLTDIYPSPWPARQGAARRGFRSYFLWCRRCALSSVSGARRGARDFPRLPVRDIFRTTEIIPRHVDHVSRLKIQAPRGIHECLRRATSTLLAVASTFASDICQM